MTVMFTREVAKAIVNRKPDSRLVARVVYLGQKADDGTLTEAERDEYTSIIGFGDLVSLLKSKAHHFLDENPS